MAEPEKTVWGKGQAGGNQADAPFGNIPDGTDRDNGCSCIAGAMRKGEQNERKEDKKIS